MDYFHSTTVERLGAEYRADALAQVDRARLARRVAAPGPSRAWRPLSPVARLAQLVAAASARRAPAWLRR